MRMLQKVGGSAVPAVGPSWTNSQKGGHGPPSDAGAPPRDRAYLNVLGALTMMRPEGPDPVLMAVLAAMKVLPVTTAFLMFLM